MPRADADRLRRQYPVFEYAGFDATPSAGGLDVRFRFRVPPDIEFTPSLTLRDTPPLDAIVATPGFQTLVFNLGLVEMLSYWKATCSPSIDVRAGALDPDQVAWWTDLLLNGMGEFFYVNDLLPPPRDFVAIAGAGSGGVVGEPWSGALPKRALVPVGGGRDSALAGSLIRSAGLPARVMLLNPRPSATAVGRQLGWGAPLVVDRQIDPVLLQMNAAGFLNGHTPFSAYLAFLTALCAVVYGYSNVIVANERSADEGNVVVEGVTVNHQYSKSLRFERRFDEYLRRFLAPDARYFSLVRPLYELQIARGFAGIPEMFPLFQSCNRKVASGLWCGKCPKCVSVFLTSYPFIEYADLVAIFGHDLFADPDIIPVLRALLEVDLVKPFECVCTKNETLAAIHLSAKKVRQRHAPMPPVLAAVLPTIASTDAQLDLMAGEILGSFGPHNIPAPYDALPSTVLD
jgi:hypothetical protein